jgi:molybdopterin-guanine dinucleotide biosynthesis protein A
VTGIVLAGGQSRRLGTNKAVVNVGGVPLIERVLAHLRALSDDLVIVANGPEPYSSLGGRVVGDEWPGMGSLGGIYSGLRAGRYERGLVVACDMPFLNARLLRRMIDLSREYDVVMPRFDDGRMEPLHAVYGRACLAPMEAQLRQGDLRIINILPHLRVRYLTQSEIDALDPQHLSFFNVNTRQDLERARALAAEAGEE